MVVVEFSFFRGRLSYFQGPSHKLGSMDQATLGVQLFWAERMTTTQSEATVRVCAPEAVSASGRLIRESVRSRRKR